MARTHHIQTVVVTTSALVALAAVLGLRLGQEAEPLSETVVIENLAAVYMAETGGAASDCAAMPGQGAVWITVHCKGPAGRFTYAADHNGSRIATAEDAL